MLPDMLPFPQVQQGFPLVNGYGVQDFGQGAYMMAVTKVFDNLLKTG